MTHSTAPLEAYRRAILNQAYAQPVTARLLATSFKRAGHTVSVPVLQQLLNDLEAEGLLHTTRTMKKTLYHTTVTRGARQYVDDTLLQRILALLRRLSGAETARRVAHILDITVETATSYLEHACARQQLRGSNIGGLRVYQA